MWRLVLVLLYSWGTGLAFFEDSIREIKEFSWLETITTSGAMSSPTDMPVDLHLMLHTLHGAVELRLTLSPVNTVNMPVYVIHNTRGIYTSTRTEPGNENCEIYRDIQHKGAFACRRCSDGQFDIMGTMFLHRRQYSVWPSASNSRAHIHVLRSVEEPEVHTADFVIRNNSDFLGEEETVTSSPSDGTTHIYTVELVMHSDYKDFSNFQQRFGFSTASDTISTMAVWYATVAELITLTYGTVVVDEPDINIVVKVVSLVIATSAGASPWSEENVRDDGSIDAQAAIQDFRNHRRVLVDRLVVPRGDHAMAFTGYDMWTPSSAGSVLGIAFIGTMCGSFDVSLIEDQFKSWEWKVAAHELGHSMGSGHDSDIGCYDNHFFVMSAFVVLPNQVPDTLFDNLFKFSKCSIARFETFLRSASCTLQNSNLPNTYFGDSRQLSDADGQCHYSSRFCREDVTS